ncbi:hypothetical protein CFN78_17790 [Amycolatopsis antarctica]|uniref:ABC3 transporter permease C-terminal domain-containing protein n=1 Tax=Amycolatopsis antarctica TaxID=1854586 RepID=A0A263D1L0_9PSEU|nr:FtsX-like permease family protein [Amycolatopsis antarctica]OZM71988.1 hypothetical protein CFN78_17790 [Amycolatopsis antarctica]
MMWRLALRTVRARPVSYLAPAGVLLAGTALLTALATLAETGLAGTGDGTESLAILAAIMGGWTMAIVVYGVVSTIALVIRQRERELALLRSIGTTAAQIRTTVLAETTTVALPAVLAGVLPGIALGSFLLDRMGAVGVVSGPIELVAGWRPLTAGAAVALLSAVAAALLAGRRAGKVAPVLALAEAADAPVSAAVLSRPARYAGLGFVLLGVGSGIGTLFMANGPLLAAAAGPACIAVAIGLALLSPAVVALAARAAPGAPGAVGRLALRNLGARAARSGSIVGPLALLVGIAAGTLYMQSTEDSTAGTGGAAAEEVAPQFAAANYLVVAMIITFSTIAVTNTLVAATWHRRREFGLLRLTASTRRQVLRMVTVESALSAGIAIVLGTVAAAATTIPFSIVKTGSALPAGPLWMYLAIVAGSGAVAVVTTFTTTLRATETRPIAALAA